MVDLIRIPAFLYVVFTMYWVVPLLVIFGYLKPWKMTGLRNDAYQLGLGLAHFMQVKVVEVPSPPLYKKKPVIFLANHRSWADFFMDVYLTDGRAMMLSRMAVAYVFPAFMSAVLCLRAVILFKRGRIADKKAFNEWIDRKIAASPQQGLIVYPEGHRSIAAQSLPLKRGMLHYAHSRKMPVQIISTKNKELMLSEKECAVKFGVTLCVARSDAIQSKDYPDFEDFMVKVQTVWDETWAKAENADIAALKEYSPQPLGFHLDVPTRIMFLINVISIGTAFLCTMLGCLWVIMWVKHMLPPAVQVAVVVLLGYWCTLSAGKAQDPPSRRTHAPAASTPVANGTVREKHH